MTLTKKTSVSIALLIPLAGGLLWIGNKADKEEVKVVEEKVVEEKIVNKEQSILIENITNNINRQTMLMDKMYEKLLEAE